MSEPTYPFVWQNETFGGPDPAPTSSGPAAPPLSADLLRSAAAPEAASSPVASVAPSELAQAGTPEAREARIKAIQEDPMFQAGDHTLTIELANLLLGMPTDQPPQSEEPSTAGGAFDAVGGEIGMSETERQGWRAWEASTPDGQGAYTRDTELHHWPIDAHDDLAAAINAGWERLPLSVQTHLEGRGLRWHPKVVAALVRHGLTLQAIDDEIQTVSKENPNDPRLPDLLVRRHGREAQDVIHWS